MVLLLIGMHHGPQRIQQFVQRMALIGTYFIQQAVEAFNSLIVVVIVTNG